MTSAGGAVPQSTARLHHTLSSHCSAETQLTRLLMSFTVMFSSYPVLLLALSCCSLGIAAQQPVPEYVKQCKLSAPHPEDCIINSLHHLRRYLVKGIPEIEVPSVEPFILDSLSLALTGGEKGYKITLRDIHMYGASNYTVTKLKLSKNGQPFEAKIRMPVIKIDANYTSSGVLIVVPASGGGYFHATLGDVLATLRGTVHTISKGGQDYIIIDKLDIDLDIKNIKMNVAKVFNNNKILADATNLFLEENGHEVLDVMMPQLRVKLAAVIKKVVSQLLIHTPVQMMTIP